MNGYQLTIHLDEKITIKRSTPAQVNLEKIDTNIKLKGKAKRLAQRLNKAKKLAPKRPPLSKVERNLDFSGFLCDFRTARKRTDISHKPVGGKVGINTVRAKEKRKGSAKPPKSY